MLSAARDALQSGRLSRAQGLLAEILETHGEHAETLHLAGVVAAQSGSLERAADCIGRAIRGDAGNAVAHNDLGIVLKRLQRHEAALRCYERAIELAPGFAEAHNNCGNLLRELNRPQAAISSYRRAISLKPHYADAHHNLGVMLAESHQWEAALASYDRAIALNPRYANAYCSRGVVLERLNRPEAALMDYDRAIGVDGALTQAFVNRGNVLRELRRVDEAIASCDRALALNPDHAQAHENRALALLLSGDYARGWVDFEWRWKNPHGLLSREARSFTQPLWLGEQSVAGRTILLHAEQGLGDALQFCRYVSMVAERGARVILEVLPSLVGLMASLSGADEVIARGNRLPDFDYHCPLMSLPLVFGTTLATIPAHVPYLYADAAKAQYWRGRLGPKTQPRVGLVWSSGFRPDHPELWVQHGERNIALSELAPLRVAPAEFQSLQKGQPAESDAAELLAQGWDGPRIHDFSAELLDFSDTAALIEQLDLVISVDTATAHLAGAMGKPVWLLTRFGSCWRWLLARDDSPWYPTMRLYRQQRRGDWDDVVQRICTDLVQSSDSWMRLPRAPAVVATR